MDPSEVDALSRVFSEQLLACLDECARGRRGLFSESIERRRRRASVARGRAAARTGRGVADVLAQQEERNALSDEFLDLCTMHGESHPGERKLARMFLERIERGEVGSPTEKNPW